MTYNRTVIDLLPKNVHFFSKPSPGWIALELSMTTFIPLLIMIPSLHYAAMKGLLGFKYRKSLYKILELLVLSELLITTANLDQMATVTCNADVMDFLMKREGGEWSGNVNCNEMLYQERTLGDCDDYTWWLRGVVSIIAWYSGLITFVSVWIFPLEDKSVSRSRVIALNTLLGFNAGMWFAYLVLSMHFRGYCMNSLGTFSTAILFYLLSLAIMIMEYYIPNTDNIHSVESSEEMEVPDISTVTEKENAAYREMEEKKKLRRKSPFSAYVASDTAATPSPTTNTNEEEQQQQQQQQQQRVNLPGVPDETKDD